MLHCVSPSHWKTGRRDTGRYYTGMRTIALFSVLMAVTLAAQAPAAPGTPIAPRPVGTMSELMVDVIYPASDAVFYISTRTPKNDAEWTELQGKTLVVAEAANLLMMPGRVRDNDRWMADAKLMRDAGAAAFAAAKKKDVDALTDLNDQLYQSCVACHQQYRVNYGRR
jgi:hypothetical protein